MFKAAISNSLEERDVITKKILEYDSELKN
jgi:hypothetical protein